MLSRLKQIVKQTVAFVATAAVVLTVMPTVPTKAADVLNYHSYQNAKQVYDTIQNKSKIYTTPDNAE